MVPVEHDDLSHSPNPTDGGFTVAFVTEDVDAALQDNNSGKVVYTTGGNGREQVYNLGVKASGIYFVCVTTDEDLHKELKKQFYHNRVRGTSPFKNF